MVEKAGNVWVGALWARQASGRVAFYCKPGVERVPPRGTACFPLIRTTLQGARGSLLNGWASGPIHGDSPCPLGKCLAGLSSTLPVSSPGSCHSGLKPSKLFVLLGTYQIVTLHKLAFCSFGSHFCACRWSGGGCYGINCVPPQNPYFEVLTLRTTDCVFGDWAFKDVIQLK